MRAIFIFYITLAITGVFAFEEIQHLYSLNFESSPDEFWYTTVCLHALKLFPCITLSISFPVVATTLRNNLQAITEDQCFLSLVHRFRRKLSKFSWNSRTNLQTMNEDAWIITIIYRICSIIPIFTSHSRLILTCFALLPPFLMVLSLDLVSLLKITWVTGVGVQYIVPALLVHASRQKTAMIKSTNHHQSYFKVEATSKWMIFGYDIWIILPIFWPILLFVSVIIINLLCN